MHQELSWCEDLSTQTHISWCADIHIETHISWCGDMLLHEIQCILITAGPSTDTWVLQCICILSRPNSDLT